MPGRRMDKKKQWILVAEVETHLGVNPDTVYKWIVRSGMPGHKIGRLWKFRASGHAWVWFMNGRDGDVFRGKARFG